MNCKQAEWQITFLRNYLQEKHKKPTNLCCRAYGDWVPPPPQPWTNASYTAAFARIL